MTLPGQDKVPLRARDGEIVWCWHDTKANASDEHAAWVEQVLERALAAGVRALWFAPPVAAEWGDVQAAWFVGTREACRRMTRGRNQ